MEISRPIVGIIAEYNPFHSGHLYQIQEIRRKLGSETTVVVCLSGSFVQRGAPAIFSKQSRAAMAIIGGLDIKLPNAEFFMLDNFLDISEYFENPSRGADLVVEMPVRFSLSSAQDFALGGVGILKKLGITHLSFGIEEDDLENIYSHLNFQKSEIYNNKLKESMSAGASYPRAAAEAAEHMGLSSLGPNSVLAAEYLKHLSSIIPLAIKRDGEGHHSTEILDDPKIHISASAARRQIKNTGFSGRAIGMGSSFNEMPVYTDMLSQAFFYKIHTSDPTEISKIQGISEGLENRIYKFTGTAKTITELQKLVKTKRYSRALINRITMSVLLDLKAQTPKEKTDFLKFYPVLPLAGNSIGTRLLRNVRVQNKMPEEHRAARIRGLYKTIGLANQNKK